MRNRIANNTRTETLGLYGSWQNSSHIPYPAIERYKPFIADPGASDIARIDIYLSYRLNGTGFARFSRTAFLRLTSRSRISTSTDSSNEARAIILFNLTLE